MTWAGRPSARASVGNASCSGAAVVYALFGCGRYRGDEPRAGVAGVEMKCRGGGGEKMLREHPGLRLASASAPSSPMDVEVGSVPQRAARLQFFPTAIIVRTSRSSRACRRRLPGRIQRFVAATTAMSAGQTLPPSHPEGLRGILVQRRGLAPGSRRSRAWRPTGTPNSDECPAVRRSPLRLPASQLVGRAPAGRQWRAVGVSFIAPPPGRSRFQGPHRPHVCPSIPSPHSIKATQTDTLKWDVTPTRVSDFATPAPCR